MRTLLWIPIIHTPAEMGFAEEAVRQIKAELYGQPWAERYEEEIKRFWDDLEQRLADLTVDRVYNDSLPLGGEIGRELVATIATAGSRNYQLLSMLVAKGAQLEATEDPRLLREEIEHIQRIVTAPSPQEKTTLASQYKQRLLDLIQERDRYIARQINKSLLEGERGLIFLGASHDIRPYLDHDIVVVRLTRGR